MVQAARSPGSALKPFLYGLALDEGLIHSESLLADVPQSFSGYQPGNFQANFSGPVSASEALQKSLNVPAVEVLERLGPQRFVSLLRRGGLKLELPRGATANLSVILGGAAVNLEGLVGAYTALARAGVSGQPRYLPDAPLEEARMMSEGAAFIIRDVLESGGPVARQVEGGVGTRRGIAWKTGTSFGFRDAWAIGVSDGITVGVWVGAPTARRTPASSAPTSRRPAGRHLCGDRRFAASRRAFRRPASRRRICWPLGARSETTPPELCHQERTAWILNDTAPPTFPDRLRGGAARYTDYRDAASGQCAYAPVAPPARCRRSKWRAGRRPSNPGSMRRRAPARCHPTGRRLQRRTRRRKAACDRRHQQRRNHPPRRQRPGARAASRSTRRPEELIWLLNGRQIGRLPANRALQQRIREAGRYRITVMDDAGRYDRVEISVR
jgi:penicillin-binding protein 1C